MQKEGAGVDRRAGFMAKAVVALSGRRVQPLSEVRSLVLKWGMVVVVVVVREGGAGCRCKRG